MRTARQRKVNLVMCGMIACGIFGFQSSRANTITEGFDYTPGSSIFAQTGGSGWSDAWETDTNVGGGAATNTTGSMTYSGITSTGGKLVVSGDGRTSGDATLGSKRHFTTSFSSGSAYFSVLLKNLNGSARYFGMALYSGGTERSLLGSGSGFLDWTINKVSTNGLTLITAPGQEGVASNGALDSGIDSTTAAMVLLKVDFNASSQDSSYENLTFWVNPDLSQPENVADAVGGQAFSTSLDFGTIDGIRINSGAYSSTYGTRADFNMDEISISDATPFAVPEPATFGLFGIFGLGVIAYRRFFRR